MSTTIDRPTRRRMRVEEPDGGGEAFVANASFVLAGLLVAVQVLAAHVIPPLAVFAAIYVALGLAVRRMEARWPTYLTLAVAVLHVAGSYEFFAANLAHPESPASFITEAAILITGVTMITGAILLLRGARPGARRTVAWVAGTLVAIAVVASTVAATRVDSDARQPGDIAVQAERSAFTEQVEVPAGDATLWVDNRDAFHHTFVVDGTDARAVLPGNTSVRVDVTLAPGTYRYWCDVPGHDDMEGVLVVR